MLTNVDPVTLLIGSQLYDGTTPVRLNGINDSTVMGHLEGYLTNGTSYYDFIYGNHNFPNYFAYYYYLRSIGSQEDAETYNKIPCESYVNVDSLREFFWKYLWIIKNKLGGTVPGYNEPIDNFPIPTYTTHLNNVRLGPHDNWGRNMQYNCYTSALSNMDALMDAVFDAAEELGVYVTFNLGGGVGTGSWSNPDTVFGGTGHITDKTSTNFANYVTYCVNFINRYKGRSKLAMFDLYNEPGIEGTLYGGSLQYGTHSANWGHISCSNSGPPFTITINVPPRAETASYTNGSAIVTTTNSAFTNVNSGTYFTVNGITKLIASKQSNNQITMSTNYTSTGAGTWTCTDFFPNLQVGALISIETNPTGDWKTRPIVYEVTSLTGSGDTITQVHSNKVPVVGTHHTFTGQDFYLWRKDSTNPGVGWWVRTYPSYLAKDGIRYYLAGAADEAYFDWKDALVTQVRARLNNPKPLLTVGNGCSTTTWMTWDTHTKQDVLDEFLKECRYNDNLDVAIDHTYGSTNTEENVGYISRSVTMTRNNPITKWNIDAYFIDYIEQLPDGFLGMHIPRYVEEIGYNGTNTHIGMDLSYWPIRDIYNAKYNISLTWMQLNSLYPPYCSGGSSTSGGFGIPKKSYPGYPEDQQYSPFSEATLHFFDTVNAAWYARIHPVSGQTTSPTTSAYYGGITFY